MSTFSNRKFLRVLSISLTFPDGHKFCIFPLRLPEKSWLFSPTHMQLRSTVSENDSCISNLPCVPYEFAGKLLLICTLGLLFPAQINYITHCFISNMFCIQLTFCKCFTQNGLCVCEVNPRYLAHIRWTAALLSMDVQSTICHSVSTSIRNTFSLLSERLFFTGPTDACFQSTPWGLCEGIVRTRLNKKFRDNISNVSFWEVLQ